MPESQKSKTFSVRCTPLEHAELLAAAPGGKIGPYVLACALQNVGAPEREESCLDELDLAVSRARELLSRPGLGAVELDKLLQAIERGRRIRVSETERLISVGGLIEGDVVRHGLQAVQEGIVELAGDNLESELAGYGVPAERVERLRRNLLENLRRFAPRGTDV